MAARAEVWCLHMSGFPMYGVSRWFSRSAGGGGIEASNGFKPIQAALGSRASAVVDALLIGPKSIKVGYHPIGTYGLLSIEMRNCLICIGVPPEVSSLRPQTAASPAIGW